MLLIRPMARHSTRPPAFTVALPPRPREGTILVLIDVDQKRHYNALIDAIRSSGRTEGSNRLPFSSEIRREPARCALRRPTGPETPGKQVFKSHARTVRSPGGTSTLAK
jgi:hypothetical protein